MSELNLRQPHAKLYLYFYMAREMVQIFLSLLCIAISGAIVTLIFEYVTDGPVLLYAADIPDLSFLACFGLVLLIGGLIFFHEAWWDYRYYYTLFRRVCTLDKMRKADALKFFPQSLALKKSIMQYRYADDKDRSVDLTAIKGISLS